MPSFCPGCKLTFEDKDLATGPASSQCPRCGGTLQPIKRKILPPLADRVERRRRITPTAPAGAVIEPPGAPSFTDSLTPTQPRGGGAIVSASEFEEEGVNRQDEPTMPGGALPAKPPGLSFMQDEPTLPRAPIPRPQPPRPDRLTPTAPAGGVGPSPPTRSEPAPLPPPSTAMINSEPRAAPAGIVPPAALGGPRSADLVPPGMVSADGRRNAGLSDVFAPVGALDPSSGEVIDTGPIDRPVFEDGSPEAGAPTGADPAKGSRSPGERLLEFDEGSSVTGGDLELDLGRSGLDHRSDQPGVGIGPGMSSGQIPKARPAPRPEIPIGTRPIPTHEMKAVVRPGLPGWARLLVLLVVLGVAGIVALELVSAESEIAAESPEAAALNTLADVAAETARAELLLADIEQEREETRKSRRKASARKAKPKSRKHAKTAKAKSVEEDDDDDGDDDRESARSRALHHYKQGNEQLKQRAFASAVQAFHAALKADPSFAYAHRGLGVAYASMKDPKKAIQQYRLYLQKAPAAPDAPQVRKILEQAASK